MNNNKNSGEAMAAEYAATVANDLRVLDALSEHWDELADYVDACADYETGDATAEDVSAMRDELADAIGGVPMLGRVLDLRAELGGDDRSEALDTWFDGALDVEVRGVLRAGTWEVDEVAVLVAFGGPTARIIWDGSDTLTVAVSWWSAEQVRRVECEAVAVLLAGYAEAVTA